MEAIAEKPNRAGARKGNNNRFGPGLRSAKAKALVIGALPKSVASVKRIISRHRVIVELAAIDRHGSLGLYHDALVQSSTRHELVGLLAMRWLRNEGDNLPLSDRLALLRQIQVSTDGRDKCLERLGLNVAPREANPWDLLAAAHSAAAATPPPAVTHGNEHAAEASSAPDTTPEAASSNGEATP